MVCPNLEHAALKLQSDPLSLLPQLLNHLIELGDLAREINHAFGGNGHCPKGVAKLIRQLTGEMDDGS